MLSVILVYYDSYFITFPDRSGSAVNTVNFHWDDPVSVRARSVVVALGRECDQRYSRWKSRLI